MGALEGCGVGGEGWRDWRGERGVAFFLCLFFMFNTNSYLKIEEKNLRFGYFMNIHHGY